MRKQVGYLTEGEVVGCHHQQITFKLLLYDVHRLVLHVSCICSSFQLIHCDTLWQLYGEAVFVNSQLLDVVVALNADLLFCCQMLYNHVCHVLPAACTKTSRFEAT